MLLRLVSVVKKIKPLTVLSSVAVDCIALNY